jgi:NitT/TauT family transport system substrate-binding protein
MSHGRAFAFCLAFALLQALYAAEVLAQVRAKPPEKITLALQWLTQCQFAGYYVALEKGYYRDEGIELTILPGAADSNPIQLVSMGTAQFGTRWFADLVVAIDKGVPMLSIAQILGSSGLVLVTRADSGIRQPRDFAGRSVGVWFFGNEVQFYALMSQAGVDPARVRVAPLQSSLKPLLSRQLDVVSAMTYNELPALLRSGLKREQLRVFDFNDYGLDFPGDALFAPRALLKDRPELARGMVRASLRGWRDALDDPEAAVRIVLKHDRTKKLDAAHQRDQMREIARLAGLRGRKLGEHSAEDSARTVAILSKGRLISRALANDEVFTNALLP